MQDRAYDDNVVDDMLNLFRKVSIAMRFIHYADAVVDLDAKSMYIDMKTPWIAKILTGGAIGENVNFFAYAIFEEGEPPKFEDAWVDIHNLMPLSVMVGQFQLSDFMFPRELRLTRSDYYIYKVGNLTYHRGISFGLQDLSFGLVNGNGIPPAEGDGFDNNNQKWYFAHYAIPVDFQLGIFGLYGDDVDSTGYYRLFRLGADFARNFGNAYLFAQVLYGFDANADNSFYGGFLGLDYVKDDRNIISLLFNMVEAPNTSFYYGMRMYSLSLTYSHYIYRNAKVLLEAEYEFLSRKALFTFGADYAF